MTGGSTRVRPAILSDAAALGAIHVAAWRAAYQGIMAAEYLAGLEVAKRAELWTATISRASPTEVVMVAERDGSLLGFCMIGNARRPDEAGLGEVQALNVEPGAWGTGAGEALLVAAESWLGGRGLQRAILWVVEGNGRARRFYERHGWDHDGHSDLVNIGGVPIAEVRYGRRLGR